jgi:hypothetical protein
MADQFLADINQTLRLLIFVLHSVRMLYINKIVKANVMIVLGFLLSARAWPRLRLCAHPVALKRPPSQTSGQLA